MTTQMELDIDAVLRTLRLAHAQVLSLQRQCASEAARAGELADIEIALKLILKKLAAVSQ
jgi:hypothetical protein